MRIRESRLLVAAVVLGSLAAVPLACGGSDNGTPNDTGDSDTTGGDNPGGDGIQVGGGDGDIQAICQDILDKINTCQPQILCVYTTDTFLSDCVSTAAFTPDQRDAFVASSCSSISDALCNYTTGTCSAELACAVFQPTQAICVTTDGQAPTGAASCTSTCTDQTQLCTGPSGGALSCYDQCAPPPCTAGLHCTIVDSQTGDSACLQSDGNVPGTATTCDTDVTECTATQGCVHFNGAAHKYCVERCFLNDGTYLPASVPPSNTIVLKH